jgi:hypothetical protein
LPHQQLISQGKGLANRHNIPSALSSNDKGLFLEREREENRRGEMRKHTHKVGRIKLNNHF